MEKVKVFHIINKGERKGALEIARAIKKDSGLKIGPGWYGEGAYAHYYNNVDKPLFKDKPMVIFSVEGKRVRHIKQSPFPFIVMKGKKDEGIVPIDIIEFRNIAGI
jgi:hypothetical protein